MHHTTVKLTRKPYTENVPPPSLAHLPTPADWPGPPVLEYTPPPAMSENPCWRSIECSPDYFGSVNFGMAYCHGYDVECNSPTLKPVNLERAKKYDSGHYYIYNLLGSATFAVAKINELTGRNYELVEIVKAVDTPNTLMYLTLTARARGTDAHVETFQALVEVPYGRYNIISKLVEWRRKD